MYDKWIITIALVILNNNNKKINIHVRKLWTSFIVYNIPDNLVNILFV